MKPMNYFPLPQTESCFLCDLISGNEDDWSIIARLEAEGHPAHLDHLVVTEEKRNEVANLRKHLGRPDRISTLRKVK